MRADDVSRTPPAGQGPPGSTGRVGPCWTGRSRAIPDRTVSVPTSAEQPHPHQAGRTGAAKPALPQSRRPTDLCLVHRLHHWRSVCFSHSVVQHQRCDPLWGLSHSPGGTDPISCPVGTVGYARVSLGSDGGPQAPAGWTEEREQGETELVGRAGLGRGLHRLTCRPTGPPMCRGPGSEAREHQVDSAPNSEESGCSQPEVL